MFHSRALAPRALSQAEKIIVASGVALVLCSLLTWFSGPGVDRNAWANPPSAIGVVVATLMLLQISLVRHPQIKLPTPPLPWGWVHLILGGLSLGLILVQFLVGDSVEVGGVGVTLQSQLGAFLGLLAAAGLAYGGFRASRDH